MEQRLKEVEERNAEALNERDEMWKDRVAKMVGVHSRNIAIWVVFFCSVLFHIKDNYDNMKGAFNSTIHSNC